MVVSIDDNNQSLLVFPTIIIVTVIKLISFKKKSVFTAVSYFPVENGNPVIETSKILHPLERKIRGASQEQPAIEHKCFRKTEGLYDASLGVKWGYNKKEVVQGVQ